MGSLLNPCHTEIAVLDHCVAPEQITSFAVHMSHDDTSCLRLAIGGWHGDFCTAGYPALIKCLDFHVNTTFVHVNTPLYIRHVALMAWSATQWSLTQQTCYCWVKARTHQGLKYPAQSFNREMAAPQPMVLHSAHKPYQCSATCSKEQTVIFAACLVLVTVQAHLIPPVHQM